MNRAKLRDGRMQYLYTDRWTDDPEHTMPPTTAIIDSRKKDVSGSAIPAL